MTGRFFQAVDAAGFPTRLMRGGLTGFLFIDSLAAPLPSRKATLSIAGDNAMPTPFFDDVRDRVTIAGHTIPAPPSYFDDCLAKVPSSFLFAAKAVIDTNVALLREAERRLAVRVGSTLRFLRVTDLLFLVPGRACLVQARYCEKVYASQASQGRDETHEGEASWEFSLLVGMPLGVWNEGPADGPGPRWLYLPEKLAYAAGTFSIPLGEEGGDRGSTPVFDEHGQAVAHDARYEVLSGRYFSGDEPAGYVSPDAFASAFTCFAEVLGTHARIGTLGDSHGPVAVCGLSPWLEFVRCEDLYWRQVPLERLAGAFTQMPIRLRNAEETHESIMEDRR